MSDIERPSETEIEAIRLADDLAAAAARVCAEYDGIHRLRAQLSRWFNFRAGIHAPFAPDEVNEAET